MRHLCLDMSCVNNVLNHPWKGTARYLPPKFKFLTTGVPALTTSLQRGGDARGGTFLALGSCSRLGRQASESHRRRDFHSVARINIREGPRSSASGHLQERNHAARSVKVKLVIKDWGSSGCSWQENQLIIPQKQETPKHVISSNHYPSHHLLFKVLVVSHSLF